MFSVKVRCQHVAISSCAVATLTIAAGSAHAQCAFGPGPKAVKSQKLSLVKAFSVCDMFSGPPNTATPEGIPGCTPPAASSAYNIDPVRGSCKVTMKAKPLASCPSYGIPCLDVNFSAMCSGILESGTATNGSGWALEVTLRVTSDMPNTQDMTLIDFPTQFSFPDAVEGRVKIKSRLEGLWADTFGFGAGGPPSDCSVIEIVSVRILDPDGLPFAVPGLGGQW